ncbi:MAG: amino acid permease [Arcobacter sp.]|nr:MAG: amino acid permease [Arcobacter sp.]
MIPQVKLSRELGLGLLLFYGLGNIVGAGIYVLVGKVAGLAGYLSLLSFIVACVIALFTALSYAELASRYPVSAAEAVYMQEGIGNKFLSIAVGFMIILAGLLSAAVIAQGFVGYLNQFIEINASLAIILLIFILTIISIIGIKQSVVVATVFTVIGLFGLLFIIFLGFDNILHPSVPYVQFSPTLSFTDINVIFLGSFLAFYAFIGFEDMVNVAEEVTEPKKIFPLAIILALAISTLLYILIVLVALQTLSLQALEDSTAPFADMYKSLTGKDPILISIIGIFAIVNGALIQLIMASRMVYGMAKNTWLPSFFTQVSAKTKTPIRASVVVALITIGFSLFLDIVSLASLTSMLILIIFTLVNITLILIKSKKIAPKGIMQVPIWVPYCGVVLNLVLISMKLFFA